MTAGVAAVLSSGALVVGAQPAQAAPGDAAAAGLRGSMELKRGADTVVGPVEGNAVSVTAPPSKSERRENVEVNREVPGFPGLNLFASADLVEARATSEPSGSSASATLRGLEVRTPAGVLEVGVTRSEVNCPVGGTPTADVTQPANITLGGQPIDPTGPNRREVTIESLGNAKALVIVDIDKRETLSSSAAASAVIARITVEIPIVGLTAEGEVTVAPTSCETPTAPPAPPVYSGPQIAFQANTSDLWTAGMYGAVDTNLGMMPGTSPSLAAVNGGYQVAFQANSGRLWTTGALGTYDLGLGMAPGASPSVTAVGGGSGYQIAFQANTGNLWTTGALGTSALGLGMAAGTSPSITGVGSGYQVAFQANTTSLWTTGALGTSALGLGMAAGTSPSITGVGSGYQVAFQANTTSLWTTGALGTSALGLGMAAGTSPSITGVGSGYQVAFQANTTSLWTTGALGTSALGLGMAAETSPSITGVGSGYQVAFQANTTSLWSTGVAGTFDTHFGMMRETSPDI